MAALLPAHRQFDDPIASVALAAEEASLPTFRPRPRWDLTESIDYVPPTNAVFLAKAPPARRAAGGYTGETAAKLVITLLSGLIIGLTAVVLEAGIESGVRWRNGLLQRALLAQGLAGAARAHLGVALGATLATGAAVQWLAPGAAGSGVSLVMALLNGNNMSGLLTPAVFVVKLAGTVAGRVAGLALGPEAPMIHLGACVASLLCGIERSEPPRTETAPPPLLPASPERCVRCLAAELASNACC
jgi:chloride channel 7